MAPGLVFNISRQVEGVSGDLSNTFSFWPSIACLDRAKFKTITTVPSL